MGFGIKGSYNLASIQGTGADLFSNRDNLMDFHAGLYAQYSFTNFASLIVEFLYSRKGYRTDYLAPTGTAHDNRLTYIEFPGLFVTNVTETLSLHFGPWVSQLTEVTQGGPGVSISGYGYNSLDNGGIVGAEAHLRFAKVGTRFDWSLGRIFKNGATVRYNTTISTAAISDTNIRNQVFQLYPGSGFKH